MAEWWIHLTISQQIYYCVAILSTAMLIAQVILMLVGFCGNAVQARRAEQYSDTNGNTHPGNADFKLFTIRGLSVSLVIFGWAGVALLSSQTGIAVTLAVSLFCGFGAMVLIALMFCGMKGMRADAGAIGDCAVGLKGKACLKIPASRNGKGKIRIRLKKHTIEADAVTDGGEGIRHGAQVEVLGLADGNTFVVRKLTG